VQDESGVQAIWTPLKSILPGAIIWRVRPTRSWPGQQPSIAPRRCH